MTTDRLNLPRRYRTQLEALLREHVPDAEVWAYGSRVNGTSHDASDLDLVLRGPNLERLDARYLNLIEAIEESNLPILVQAHDWAGLPDSFHKRIQKDYVVLQEGRKQTTDGEWKRHDISALISEGALVIGDGYRAKNSELSSIGVPFARAGNIANGFRLSGADSFPADQLHKVGDKISRPGDTVFTSKGTVGRFAFVTDDTPSFVYSPQLSYWRPVKTRIIEPRYLYYWMTSPEFASQFKSVAGQTDMAEYVSLRDQRRMFITLPPFSEQRAIAGVLGNLDDKIEVNRRMNETLEQTARALFKSWFVDFEPVRAKMEGRWRAGQSLPGMPAHLYDLFPSRLVPSELGPVPEGWHLKHLEELTHVVYGAPFASNRFNDSGRGLPLIRIRDLSTHSPKTFTDEIHTKGHAIYPGDIVTGMDGEFRAHLWKGPTALLNQRLCHFEPLPHVSRLFLSESLREPLAVFERSKVGTTVIHLGKTDIDTIKLTVPSDELLRSFATVSEPLAQQIIGNALECRLLGAQRDALLPGLVSGKVRT